MSGDKIVETAPVASHYLYQPISTAAGAHTSSVYMKAAERTWAWLKFDASATVATFFNLSSGILGTVGAGHSAAITSIGNGWYRCSITVTAVAGTNYALIGVATGDGDTGGYAGTPGSGIYAWGAQVEPGTVATSYIATSSATVTRAADQVNVTSASINYSATAGSWWVETYLLEGATDRIIIGRNGAASAVYYNSTAWEISEGTFIYKLVSGLIGNVKRGISAFQSGDRAITGDGLAPTTDAGATTNLLSPAIVYVGSDDVDPGMNGYIRKVRYLPRRPSNAELVSMTS
jgi:hypothetical protein